MPGSLTHTTGRGKEIERAYLDEAGKPTLGKDGYARIARVLDPHSRPIEETYFDEAGKPTLSKSGYAKVAWTYDAAGNPVEEAYFDADGKPTPEQDHVRKGHECVRPPRSVGRGMLP